MKQEYNTEKQEMLTRAGEAAYGSNWKSELARFLGINDRSVRQWANCERQIPDSIIRSMVSHLRDRAELMHRRADELVREMSYYNEFDELKIIRLPSLCPCIDRPDISNHDYSWYDVDGYIYGVSKNGHVINTAGEDTILKNATLQELAACERYPVQEKKMEFNVTVYLIGSEKKIYLQGSAAASGRLDAMYSVLNNKLDPQLGFRADWSSSSESCIFGTIMRGNSVYHTVYCEIDYSE